MPVFQPNIPTGTVPLNQDYLNLQGNNQQLNIAYGVDHVPLTDTSGIPPGGISGMHKDIHLVPQSPTPTAIAGIGQFFTQTVNDGINTDTSLYFLSGGNRLSQLTRNFQPVAAANGYTFLPGGLILQWGTATTSGTGTPNATITFSTSGNIAFPNNFFNAQCVTSETTTNRNFVVVFGGSKTQLQVTAINSSGTAQNAVTFFWMAIGN